METITSRQNPLCVQVRKLAAAGNYRRRSWPTSSVTAPSCCRRPCAGRRRRCRRCCAPARRCCPLCRADVRAGAGAGGGDGLPRPPPRRLRVFWRSVCLEDRPLPRTLRGQPLCGPGRRPGPGQRGHDAADCGRLLVRRVVPGGGLRGPLVSPKTVAGLHGGGVPLPGVELHGPGAVRCFCAAAASRLWGAALREDTADVESRGLRPGRLWPSAARDGACPGSCWSMCDGTVRIPMQEHCESLNAAAAAAVLLWEMARAAGKV